MALVRFVKNVGKNIQIPGQNRNVSLSATTYLKEIIEKKVDNTLIIEAIIKEDENEKRLLKPKQGACTICSSGIDIKHTDVLILSQFIRSDGRILPQRITGLCKIQQKRISTMILMAQAAGLLPGPLGDLSTRRKWKKFNTYYDETTIKTRYM
ncbi:PREDICTED: 28S ribosomal protein S18a, mitochondrial [Dufourea novaeangliae]|uniref:28S ribosomal protein S18a, mitochondrial n=1 Tax=Dufourea novaeangliae TaxID=178035 RepID=A0A154P3X3_DUFNO|nr:PREDICTED: 28S ribosomal protein S18a, mitochondrial [Dufourea novaeangliae]KZC06616.1 28S ribosomal protein S18a, mitochondrial [Dufourea novaeangliae]